MGTNKQKDINGYSGLYAITTDGRVWSYPKKNGHGKRNGHWMKLYIHNGYVYVNLCKNGKYKNHLVHRLIAFAFLDKKLEDEEVNHLNGIKNDNRVENIEWCSKSENCRHAYKNGLHIHIGLKGEKNGNAKLKEEDIILIRKCNKPYSWIMKKFNISKSATHSIITKKTWRHI